VVIKSGTLALGGSGALGSGSLTVAGGVLDLGSQSYTPSSSFAFHGGGIADGTLSLASNLTADIDEDDAGFVSATIAGSCVRRRYRPSRRFLPGGVGMHPSLVLRSNYGNAFHLIA
jgi:hypothetical protein